MSRPENEIWKDIPGYEGLYQVSNLGRVKSLDRTLTYSNGSTHNYRGRILRPIAKDQYKMVQLGRGAKMLIHRLVAICFVPNPSPEEFNIINHIDENPSNNVYTNLEWCNNKYNLNYGNRVMKYSISRSRKVAEVDGKGVIIKIYQTAFLAAKELGLNADYIRRVCKGYQKSHGGKVWKYV